MVGGSLTAAQATPPAGGARPGERRARPAKDHLRRRAAGRGL